MDTHQKLTKEFEAAYDELIEPIFRYLVVRLGDRERARELAQETFMRTWSYAAKGHTINNMRAFLYTTAGNLFKNELRAKRDTISLDAAMNESHFEPHTSEPSPERTAEGAEVLELVSKLKPEYREVILLCYVDDLPVKEIAQVLDISPITVSVRLHRALKALRAIHTPHTP